MAELTTGETTAILEVVRDAARSNVDFGGCGEDDGAGKVDKGSEYIGRLGHFHKDFEFFYGYSRRRRGMQMVFSVMWKGYREYNL